MALKKVNMHRCPNCGDDLAVIDVYEGATSSGTVFSNSFVKCRSGCSKRQILHSAGVSVRRKQLPDKTFLEMITHARSIGKRITTADKQRELAIRMRLKRAAN